MNEITAEQVKDLFAHGGHLELTSGDRFSQDDLRQYIDACDIDTDDQGVPLSSQWQILADVLGAPDPGDTNELTAIATAANRITAAETDRDKAIRDALAAGYSAVSIAHAANLSRARIYQIRDGRR